MMDADLFTEGPVAAGTGWREALARIRQRLHFPGWLSTLKARLALGAVAALLLAVTATAWQFGVHAERDLMDQALDRERTEAQRTAADIGRRLRELQGLLEHLASRVPPGTESDPDRMAQLLQGSALLEPYFSNVFAAGPDGAMLAFVDAGGVRFPPTSLRDRPYFRQSVDSRAAVISSPLAGRISSEPVVVFSQPVVRDGQVVAVVGGALRIASRDLMERLTGGSGEPDHTYQVLTDRAGTVMRHPEGRFLLEPVTSDPRMQAVQGVAPPARTQGAEAASAWLADGQVVATATDDVAGWQVWRMVPQVDVLAPLHRSQLLAWRDATAVVALFGLLIVMLLVWQLSPLVRLERRAAALLTGDGAGDWPTAQGEIGRLARTLQHVWAERSQVESFNQQVLQKLGSVMAAAPVGLAFTRNQCFELVSAEFSHLLGYSESQILGQRAQVVFASNEDYAALGVRIGEAFGAGLPYSGDWLLLRADGSRFWGHLRARPVEPGNASAGTIWSINDVTEEVHSRRELEHAALHDALTGVVNRQGFEQAVQTLFDSQPGSRPASLVMIDLDHFKPINDTAGHAAGDAMLVAVAQAIASRVRTTDVVVRLGGDEFALLLTGCTHDRAMFVAEKVREAITDLALTWEAHTLRVGASLGVAELTDHHESPAQWLAQADAACYDAKRSGRGRVRTSRQPLRVVPREMDAAG